MLPSLSPAERIKLKFDEVHNIMMEQERRVRTEMANLVRERDSLKSKVECLLGLEKKTVKMEEEIQKLRREKADVEKELELNRRKWAPKKKRLEMEEEMKADAEREMEMNRTKWEPEKKRLKMEEEKRREKADQRKEELSRRENRQRRAKMKMKMKESGKSRFSKEDLPDFDENAGIGSSKKGSNCRITMIKNMVRGCKLERIDVIKVNLDKENLERFEKSCFGHLLKISDDNLKFQGQLISHLLLHMDKGDSRKVSLVFTINNSKIEFGLREFCHITGLSDVGTSATTTTSSSIHKKVFQSRPSIDLKDIEEAFLKVSHANEGRGELTLKLVILYFLFGTLLGNERRNVNLQYLHLVDDLHKFNVFPWGRVAYELLFKSISALQNRMDGVTVTDETLKGVDVSGFTFALQIWAYEVMPFVAEYCASRAHNFDKGTPPILHWRATKILYFNYLKEIFAPGVLIKPLSMPKEMDLSKKGSRRFARSVKAEDCSEPVAAARDNRGKEPEMRACSRANATGSDGKVKMRSGDDDHVIVLSDSRDDEAPDADEEDTDNDSCSDSYRNALVAMLQSRKKRKKKDS